MFFFFVNLGYFIVKSKELIPRGIGIYVRGRVNWVWVEKINPNFQILM